MQHQVLSQCNMQIANYSSWVFSESHSALSHSHTGLPSYMHWLRVFSDHTMPYHTHIQGFQVTCIDWGCSVNHTVPCNAQIQGFQVSYIDWGCSVNHTVRLTYRASKSHALTESVQWITVTLTYRASKYHTLTEGVQWITQCYFRLT